MGIAQLGPARVNITLRILELTDNELEEFVELWAERAGQRFYSVERIGKANDKGRDVIGFRTNQKHEGPWVLYQCKRKTLRGSLGVPEALAELGKVFFHHVRGGSYKTLPEKYVFVSPRGVVGPLQDLIFNPSDLKAALLTGWDKHCAGAITAKTNVALSAEIKAAIEGYDFGNVSYLAASGLAKDEASRPALVQVLGLLPGDAPLGVVPDSLQPEELEYVDQLRHVYGDASGQTFATADEVLAHAEHGGHLRDQRIRFFDAASFKRFHRDNTSPEALDAFQEEVYQGVVDVHRMPHRSLLERVDAVMRHASTMSASLLGKPARIPVRQGMCHHLANEGRMRWIP